MTAFLSSATPLNAEWQEKAAGTIFKVYIYCRSLFICQGTSTRRQQSDICGLRVKLPPDTTSLIT